MAKSNVPLFAIIERVDREADALTDEEILARLNGEKPVIVKPRSFQSRITAADRIHLRALGVRL